MELPDTRHRRAPERGGVDLDTARAIIDAARVCHVGVTIDEQPYVIPMASVRDDDDLLLHGSAASRLMRALSDGAACCATITHLDGLVLARSAFHSSMNYRSVMIFGRARRLEGEDKIRGLDVLTEHLLPGRLRELRRSTPQELAATTLVALPIETFTTKVRTGPPKDAKTDLDLSLWAGVVPMNVSVGEPEAAPDLQFDLDPPDYIAEW